MNSCPSCQSQTSWQRIFGFSVRVCYGCYCIGLSETTVHGLLKSRTFQGLARNSAPNASKSISCFLCSSPTITINIHPGVEHKENTKVFVSWKYWFEHHKKGPVQIHCCQKCNSCLMNIRTFCQFKIAWDDFETEYREAQKAEEEAKEPIVGGNLFQFAMGFLLGIPHLENIPTISELPMLTYLTSVLVGYFTSRGFRDHEFFKNMVFDPGALSIERLKTFFTYSVIHNDRDHFFRVIFFFLAFAPMVEHELSMGTFMAFLIALAAGSAFIQTLLAPHALVGLGGVVSGVLTFFCSRFPTSVIGIGLRRFTAPVALVSFLFLNSESEMGLLWKVNDSASWDTFMNLGGALMGYLFHLLLPKGKATAAFLELGKQRLQKAKKVKNWRETK